MRNLLNAFAILCLLATNESCYALESGSNIGTTPIDKIIFKDGVNADSFPDSSRLARKIQAHLIELAKRGGAAAMEAELTEANASCNSLARHTYNCDIRRYRIIRSLDVMFPRYGKSDWVVSVSYDRQGSEVQNVHVTFTETSENVDYLGRAITERRVLTGASSTPSPTPRTAPLPAAGSTRPH